MKKCLLFVVAVSFYLPGAELFAKDLLTELGVQPGTPQARMIEKLKLELDLNKDGTLDDEEKAELKKRFNARQQSAMEKQDQDNDGEITPEERGLFAAKLRKFKETILKLHDADGDGKLNEAEMLAAQKWLATHKQLPLP